LKTQTTERYIGELAVGLRIEQVAELKAARDAALSQAWQIMDSARYQPGSGEFEPVRMPADPITAGERLVEAEQRYGRESQEYSQAYEAVMTDSLRALAEAARKTTWEYFSPLIQTYDRASQTYEAFGRPVIAVTASGLRWDGQAEERQRLAQEHAEEAVYNRLYGHELARSHWVLTISQCPDHAINNPETGYSYVPAINKMMIRGVHFGGEDTPDIRVSEQVGLPGLLIDEAVISRALAAVGATGYGERLDKTKLHGTQILIDKTKLTGVMDFVELLDDLAGPGVFMGEPADLAGDYQAVPELAEARQSVLERQAKELAGYITQLARQRTDHAWAAWQIERKLNSIIHVLAKQSPQTAREAFGEPTARGYAQARLLEQAGQYAQADNLRLITQTEAPPAAFCGAGSCGLKSASPAETLTGHGLGLLGELILDTVRRCPKGHVNSILYDKFGSKACKRCRLTELKTRPSAKPKFKSKPNRNKLKLKQINDNKVI